MANIILKNNKKRKCFETFLSLDYKFLNISYPSIESNEDDYNAFLDDLNNSYQIYDITEELFLETDFICSLPSGIKKFKKLEKIEVSGSRFWHLTMEQMPNTVRTVILTDHSNLQSKCIIGMDKFISLEHLFLDYGPFNLCIFLGENETNTDEDIVLIPLMPKLKYIVFNSGICYSEDDLIDDWKDRILNNKLFSNIKDKITNIIYNDYRLTIELQN